MDTMNYVDQMPRLEAHIRAAEIADILRPLCQDIQICGSIRRGKNFVGDAEIVAYPRDTNTFLARLDRLVSDEKIDRALYGNGTLRWGSRYRGLVYRELKIEIFTANQNNWGYITWLRTGPGDANTHVMQAVMPATAYAARGGYIWQGNQKVHVPNETIMFRILRMPYLHPRLRSVENYKANQNRLPVFALPTFVKEIPTPTQTTLF